MIDDKMFIKPSNLLLSEKEVQDAIFYLQDCYKQKKIEHRLFEEENYIPENIISLYVYYLEQNDYQAIVKNYKLKYIDNEAEIEPNVTLEERIGLAHIYDFISSYDFKNKTPNIFVDTLKMHCLLYSACPYPEFGGKLRDEPVRLSGSSYEVIDSSEARKIFQSYVTKKIEINQDDILKYIEECIKVMVDLIKIQPFRDGNKRIFRSLLNLMLGKIGLPPIYININERDVYKDVLLNAIETNDYTNITKFYYYKICDAIVELDLMDSLQKTNEKETGYVIK